MGHEKKSKLDVQKEKLKNVLINLIKTNIAAMEFRITMAKDSKEKVGLRKYVKQSETAIGVVDSIQHYEILISLYNAFMNGKEVFFLTCALTCGSKDTIKWDRTEKGFKEFLQKEQDAVAQSKQEREENLKKVEFIKKAKEEGKQVEMIFKNGKLVPCVVEEKAN